MKKYVENPHFHLGSGTWKNSDRLVRAVTFLSSPYRALALRRVERLKNGSTGRQRSIAPLRLIWRVFVSKRISQEPRL